MQIPYQGPYLWENLINFLGHRAILGVETIVDGNYCRTVTFDDGDQPITGVIQVAHDEQAQQLRVHLSDHLIDYQALIKQRVIKMFDTNHDPQLSYQILQSLSEVHPDLPLLGLRIPGAFDFFEVSVRAVLGQQISVKAASTLAGRLALHCGTPIESDVEGLTHLFPSPASLIKNEKQTLQTLGGLGINQSKARAIVVLAHYFIENKEADYVLKDPEVVIAELCELPQIGPWTANYIAMRTLQYHDGFLESDYGVKKALKMTNHKEILALSEKWKPYRGYATFNLWEALAKE